MPAEVVIVERIGADSNTFQQLPFALTPGPPVQTTALRDSIETTAAAWAAGVAAATAHRAHRHPAAPRSPHPQRRSAAPRHRRRRRHHRRGAGPGLVVPGGARTRGTGKTHTAAAVITRLVNENGRRVGVVTQSRATVENLLDCVVAAGLDAQRVAK